MFLGGWMGGSKSRFKDCLQQLKIGLNQSHPIKTKNSQDPKLPEGWCRVVWKPKVPKT
jgi:hypothetical protein